MTSLNTETVFVVDDDKIIRQQLLRLLEKAGFSAQPFASASELLAAIDATRSGCLLLDVNMPGMSGLELQKALGERNIRLPIIFLTAHGTIPMAVEAIRAGAVTFLEKPVVSSLLIEAVTQAVEHDWAQHRIIDEQLLREKRLEQLTDRERQVMDAVVRGMTNKDIAKMLGISFRTVEFHRARLMEKLEAESVADLIRMTTATGPSAAQ